MENMKRGDIVYFKSIYTCISDENMYHFKPGDRYRIDEINDFGGGVGWIGRSGTITNLEDGTQHFTYSQHWSRIVSKEQWRELQLNKVLNKQ